MPPESRCQAAQGFSKSSAFPWGRSHSGFKTESSLGSSGPYDVVKAWVDCSDRKKAEKKEKGLVGQYLSILFGVLPSSIGVSVRRFCGFVLGGLSGRVSFEVSFGVCLGEGSQIQGGLSGRVSSEVSSDTVCVCEGLQIVWIRFGCVGQGRKIDDTLGSMLV